MVLDYLKTKPRSINRLTERTVFSAVDLEAMARLRVRLRFLGDNVFDLMSAYTKRRGQGFDYTESERAKLDSGLPDLEESVTQLSKSLEGICGYPEEIKKIVGSYLRYESQYRTLRSLNKSVSLRRTAGKAEADQQRLDEDGAKKGGFFRKTWESIKNYECPCYRYIRSHF